MAARQDTTRVGELTFKGDVLQWIGEMLRENPSLPFSAVKQELPSPRAGEPPQRHDLVLLDHQGRPALTGELRLPDHPRGHHPYLEALVRDAHDKADRAGVKWFITWNVNDLVLWETFRPGTRILDRSFRQFPVATITDSTQLTKPAIQRQIKEGLRLFLEEFALIFTGRAVLVRKPLDETFVSILHSHLQPIIMVLNHDLILKYQKDSGFAHHFREWYVKDQGWTFEGSPKSLPDEVERATKLVAYILVNKLVFYEALRRRFKILNPLLISSSSITGDDLKREIQSYFQDAVAKTKDYETVFDWGVAGEFPFVSDSAVPLWRELIDNIGEFDFTKLNYEVIGLIFSRLIAPEEKHNFGQYYTPPDVVDLINAFCIRKAEAIILDPACGGGTFLVRAYARKKAMDNSLSHRKLLSQLWGIDIASFPVSLAVINLATRDLVEEENYPRIARKDFFEVFRGRPALGLPLRVEAKLGISSLDLQKVELPLPDVDAAVSNLPYVRQEEIETKDKLRQALATDFAPNPPQLSGRSDLHCYFWPHATPFLYEGGYIGFLSSNSWLDVDYGADLQKFILDRYKVIAILESKVERWFPEAAVNTCISVLQKCSHAQQRANNLVRFVQIKTPLAQLIPQSENEVVRQGAVNGIVRLIEGTDHYLETDTWRIYTIRQRELYHEGLDDEGKYAGAKWGKYLRAPQVFFEILERAGDKLCRLDDIAEVRFGIKTGANEFFYLTEEQAKEWGIEPEYLRPVLRAPREVEGILVHPSHLKHRVLMVHEDKRALKGKRVLKYINWGESQGYHKRPTCASRERWYDLGEERVTNIAAKMTTKYRHYFPGSPSPFLVDHRFYEVMPREKEYEAGLLASLNSSVTALYLECTGRTYGGGGGPLDVMVYEMKKILIPDPRLIRLRQAVWDMDIVKRPALHFWKEVELPDRQELDSIVLEALGFTDLEERARVQRELYEAVTDLVRSRLEKARSVEKREGKRLRPRAVAEELVKEFDHSLLRRFPQDFLPPGVETEAVAIPEGEAEVGVDLFTAGTLRVGSKVLELGSLPKAQFVKYAVDNGAHQRVDIPQEEAFCTAVVTEYETYRRRLLAQLDELARSRTTNEKMVVRIRGELERLIFPPGQ